MDKGARTVKLNWIWPFKRFVDDPELLERLADKRRQEQGVWLANATEQYKKDEEIWKIKEIV